MKLNTDLWVRGADETTLGAFEMFKVVEKANQGRLRKQTTLRTGTGASKNHMLPLYQQKDRLK